MNLLIQQIRTFSIHQLPIGNVHFTTEPSSDQAPLPVPIEFGGIPPFRAITKMGLALICQRLGRDLLDSHNLDVARRFCRFGEYPRRHNWFFPQCDIRFDLREQFNVQIGEHLLVVQSNWLTTDVILLAFGCLGFRAVLSKPALNIPDIAMIVDPSAPTWRQATKKPGLPPLSSTYYNSFSMKTYYRQFDAATDEILDRFPQPDQPAQPLTRDLWLEVIDRKLSSLPEQTGPSNAEIKATLARFFDEATVTNSLPLPTPIEQSSCAGGQGTSLREDP